MFGKVLQVLDIFVIAIGTISIFANTDASSNHAGFQRNLWNIDPRAIYFYQQNYLQNQQPNMLRKMYWYKTRSPLYFGSIRMKHIMANSHGPARYRRVPYENMVVFGTPRTYLRSTKDASVLPGPILSYNVASKTSSISSTPRTIISNADIQDTNAKDNYGSGGHSHSSEGSTMCPNKVIVQASQASPCLGAPLPFSFLETDHEPEEKPVSSVTFNQFPTTTDLPYSRYITHTYFTLDDVIVPQSYNPPNVFRNSTRKEHFDDPFIPQQSLLSTITVPPAINRVTETNRNNRIQQIFESLDLSTIAPIGLYIAPTPMATDLPKMSDIIITTRPSIIETTTMRSIISPSTTISTEFSTFKSTPKLETTQAIFVRENHDLVNVSNSNQTCAYCIENTKEMKPINKIKLRSRPKIRAEKFNRKPFRGFHTNYNSSTIYESLSTTAGPTKSNFTRLEKKVRSINLAKKQLIKTLPNITESSFPKYKRNRTRGLYLRRRPLDVNDTLKDKTLNISTGPEISSFNKTKIKIVSTLTTEKTNILTEKTNIDEPIKSTEMPIRSELKPRGYGKMNSKTTSNLNNNSVGAIMTISSNKNRSMARQRQRSKVNSKLNDSAFLNISSTEVPPLPIELYFRKAIQT